MDISTILGAVAAFGLMIAAMMNGGSILLFIDPASLMIVGGGDRRFHFNPLSV